MLELTLFKTEFFNEAIPLLRRKQSAFDIQDLPGLWRIHWQLGNTTLLSTFYTRIDQACLLWGIISIVIFATAQFTPIDWITQAWLWSGLTLAGTIGMVQLARYWSHVDIISQVIAAWAILMLGGMILTDLSIVWGWGFLLSSLCPLWLGLNALGYVYTGLKMRSRAFFLVALVHLLGIALLPHLPSWQFLTTGIVIGLSALLLAEFQWDSSGVCTTHTVSEEETA